MRKSSKKRKAKKNTNNTDDLKNESQESSEFSIPTFLSQDYITSKEDETVDLSYHFHGYSLCHKKSESILPEYLIGVKLTKTKQPFFYIENDIIYDEKEIKETSIKDVYGHYCDVGHVSFTNFSINGEKLTLPTDLVASLYPNSLTSYYENPASDEI